MFVEGEIRTMTNQSMLVKRTLLLPPTYLESYKLYITEYIYIRHIQVSYHYYPLPSNYR